jgi:hypothetical protein
MASPKLLIATAEAASNPSELPPGVGALIDAAQEILVMVPTLPSRIDWLASVRNEPRQIADQRLQIVLGQITESGKPSEGVVGSDDPLVAFDDAVADFHPDHILIGLRGPDQAGWQERGLAEQVIDRFRLPVTVFRFEND